VPAVHAVSVSSTLTGWLQGLMWATGGMAAIAGVMAFVALGSFESYIDARAGSAAERSAYNDWVDLDNAYMTVLGLAYVVAIAMFVLTVVWMNKAHKTTQRLWPGPRRWSSGWTVGGWFIPLANYFIPKMVMNEIERIAKARRWNGMVDASWRHEPTAVLGWLWWIGASVGFLAMASGSGLSDDTNASTSDIHSGYAVAGLGALGLAVALGLGAIYIRGVGRRLSPRGVTENP
jgi:hypothetical protein